MGVGEGGDGDDGGDVEPRLTAGHLGPETRTLLCPLPPKQDAKMAMTIPAVTASFAQKASTATRSLPSRDQANRRAKAVAPTGSASAGSGRNWDPMATFPFEVKALVSIRTSRTPSKRQR